MTREEAPRSPRPEIATTRNRAIAAASLVALLIISLIGSGCAADNAGREQLNAGYRALDAKDYDQALADAESYLKKTPAGPGSAEANYLEGRVYEQRAQTKGQTAGAAEVKADLDAARSAYLRGQQEPSVPQVQALLHAGVANIAYHLDDYGTAVREWQISYASIEPLDAKAWVLYRIGLCQQRLGWFPQADRSFALVRQQFPRSEPAARAAQHEGAKGFYVQVGSFTDFVNANRTVSSLRAQGLRAEVMAEPAREVVRVGPLASYAEARTLHVRILRQYPDATVVP